LFFRARNGSKRPAPGFTPGRKPVIGVTGPDEGGWTSWLCMRIQIFLAGGRAIRITPNRPVKISRLDGLILGGGADIHPSRYKAEILPVIKAETHRVDRLNLRYLLSVVLWLMREWFSVLREEGEPNPLRDRLELKLLREAVARRLPVLGICRGEQLINIFFGGTLHQEIRDFYTEYPMIETHRARKWVKIEPGTHVYAILKHHETPVNSLHHQSVNILGKGLRVAARESNDVIIQAIEHTELPFVIGLQWHPEFLMLHRRQRRFFESLVKEAASSSRAARGARVRARVRTDSGQNVGTAQALTASSPARSQEAEFI
jgi:putative glutamine amidotransferase